MKSPLRILHLEDNPNDAALVESTLRAGGISCETTCVQSREEFVMALEQGDFGLILSDFTLPAFDGLSALEIAHTQQPDLPFIIVSGTMGEERAIDSLRSGATDYILKEGLSRLVPAVRRAMQDVKIRAERRQIEAQFIQSQKMEVVGQLAGGVAHDFNNILMVIMGHNDLIASELGPESPLLESSEQIRHAAARAIGLTRQLLVFSRKQKVQPVVLDINGVLKDLSKMLPRLLGENIKMTLALGSQIGHIKADSGYLGQVLMNLAINARDAMPSGGVLTIATTHVILGENDPHPHPSVPPGDYVMLSVSDTGDGMNEEVKARLFEAFFTTKAEGQGTGLGLATCQTIIQQSDGHICFESELGHGTTFKIYFPRTEQSQEVDAKSSTVEPLPRGTETLLMVEDDPYVRRLAVNILSAQGYQVLSAANGQNALQVAREHKGPPIRLVVTDVIMPLMGGQVMAEWLQIAHPDIKILFTSGYTNGAIAHLDAPESGVTFLPKPYTSAILAHKVRAMLDDKTDTSFLRKQDETIKASPP